MVFQDEKDGLDRHGVSNEKLTSGHAIVGIWDDSDDDMADTPCLGSPHLFFQSVCLGWYDCVRGASFY